MVWRGYDRIVEGVIAMQLIKLAKRPAPSSANARVPERETRAPLGLRPGEWIEVRSEAEILATLDPAGTLDALPFMPEMRQFCGRRLQVRARADRTSMGKLGIRAMEHAVHLEDVRCDGAAHDGCSRACSIFWKEAWLKRAAIADVTPARRSTARPELPSGSGSATSVNRPSCPAVRLATCARRRCGGISLR